MSDSKEIKQSQEPAVKPVTGKKTSKPAKKPSAVTAVTALDVFVKLPWKEKQKFANLLSGLSLSDNRLKDLNWPGKKVFGKPADTSKEPSQTPEGKEVKDNKEERKKEEKIPLFSETGIYISKERVKKSLPYLTDIKDTIPVGCTVEGRTVSIPVSSLPMIFTRKVPKKLEKASRNGASVNISFHECPFSNELCKKIQSTFTPGYIGRKHPLVQKLLTVAEQEALEKETSVPDESENLPKLCGENIGETIEF